jgi:hypothetical protein
MRKIVFLTVLFSIFVWQTTAQTRKKKRATLPVKAVVAVKLDEVSQTKLPSEEDTDIWNEYVSEKYNFKIIFPSKSADVWNDEAEKFVTFETGTKKASYQLIVRSLSIVASNSQLDEFYETSFLGIIAAGNIKLISKKNVYMNRKLGKEFVYADKRKIYFQRMYILEGKLFLLSVTLPEKQYTKDFDRWAIKFFDSFTVETHDNSIG